jgi:ABC-type branched-subunit amino acid transport system substrate-binding protein
MLFCFSEAVSTYGDRNIIIQLAFGATSESLSDKNSHPLFARSCPSDVEQSQVIVALMYYYGLKNIAIVSVSDDTYSSSLASMIITR